MGLELGKIYCENCLDTMARMPDNFIDLIIWDMPYNINKAKWDKIKNYYEFLYPIFLECQRILKGNGSFYWFHNKMPIIARLMNWLEDETDFIFKQLITWHKINEQFKNYGFVQQRLSIDGMRNYYNGFTEYILFYTFQDETGLEKILCKNNFLKIAEKIRSYAETNFEKKYIEDLFFKEGRYTSKLSARVHASYKMGWNNGKRFDLMDFKLYSYLNKYLNFPFNYEDLRQEYEDLRQEYEDLRYTFNTTITKKDLLANSNIWNYSVAEQNGHVTPKPEALIQNIILHSSNKGDLIYDPMSGSGTVPKMAIKLNRRWVASEISQEYVELANRRLDQYRKQLELNMKT